MRRSGAHHLICWQGVVLRVEEGGALPRDWHASGRQRIVTRFGQEPLGRMPKEAKTLFGCWWGGHVEGSAVDLREVRFPTRRQAVRWLTEVSGG